VAAAAVATAAARVRVAGESVARSIGRAE